MSVSLEVTEIFSAVEPTKVYALRADIPENCCACVSEATLEDGRKVSVVVTPPSVATLDLESLVQEAVTPQVLAKVIADIKTRKLNPDIVPVLASHMDALGLREALERHAVKEEA